MSSLHCVCGGDGIVPAIFVHRINKTYRLTVVSCPVCNRFGEDFNGLWPGEEMALPCENEQSLKENGYTEFQRVPVGARFERKLA